MINERGWWEDDVFWKVIFRNLTPQTQQFIELDVQKRISQARAEEQEAIVKMLEQRKSYKIPLASWQWELNSALSDIITLIKERK